MSILEGRGRSEGSLQTEFPQNVKQISNLKALSALSYAKVSWDDTCLTGKEGGFQPLLLIHRIVAAGSPCPSSTWKYPGGREPWKCCVRLKKCLELAYFYDYYNYFYLFFFNGYLPAVVRDVMFFKTASWKCKTKFQMLQQMVLCLSGTVIDHSTPQGALLRFD